MSDPVTFFSESFPNSTSYYDVHENGMCYRPDGDEQISFVWKDIKYIEDGSRGRVVIILNNLKEIPVRYTTNKFTVFLKTICSRLSDIRKEQFRSQTFPLTSKYQFHLRIVVLALVLSLVVSFPVSKILFFLLLSLSIPLGIFFCRQPNSLTLDNHCLTIHHLHKTRTINYREILNIDFTVLINDYESTLGISITLRDETDITIKKLEDIIVFFIMLQIQLHDTGTQVEHVGSS